MSVRVCGSGRSFEPITHVTPAHITQPTRAPMVSRRGRSHRGDAAPRPAARLAATTTRRAWRWLCVRFDVFEGLGVQEQDAFHAVGERQSAQFTWRCSSAERLESVH